MHALERLRHWVETREPSEPDTAPVVSPRSRPTRRRRTLNRTLRLARRHRIDAAADAALSGPAIRILGPARVTGFDAPLTSQQQAFVAMVGLNGPCGRDQLVDALWGGRAISNSRFANLVAEVRAVIGRARLVQNPDGRYELLNVMTDVDRFAELVKEAGTSPSESLEDPEVQLALDRLEQAMGLIDGPVLDGGHRRFWRWIDDGYHRRYEIEQLVVSAGLIAAALALGVHQPQRARRACERCLAAVPHEERLVATLAEIHLAQGRRSTAADLVAGWEQAVRRLGLGDPPTGPRNLLLGALRGGKDGSPARAVDAEEFAKRKLV